MRILAAALFSLTVTAFSLQAAAQTFGSRPPADSGGGMAGRVERLEEQLAGLQGVVAAVETLAKNNAQGGSGYAAAGGGANAEQIRQLSEQLADLTQRLERIEARLNGGAAAAPRQDLGYGAAPASGFEDKQQLPPLGGAPAPAYNRPQQSANAGQPPLSTPPRPYGGGAPVVAPLPIPQTGPQTASAGGSSRTLFDQAYGALNRREYSAAETYFQQFLDEYPSDPMAGSAQYWLGETAFVSGEYKTAADRFLKTFTSFPANERAPEALLKLAISLRRLGNNTDACATFAELTQRYPRAPQSVLQRADSEKKRANCS